MNDQIYKREYVLSVLRNSNHDEKFKSKLLDKIKKTSIDQLAIKPPFLITMLGSLSIPVTTIGYFIYIDRIFKDVSFIAIAPLIPLLVGMSSTWILIYKYFENKAKNINLKILDAPLNEIRNLNDQLSRYVEELDKRTRIHFNSITTTKIMHSFILNQIKNALNERVTTINELLESSAYSEQRKVYILLKDNITIRTQIIDNEFTNESISLSQVQHICDCIIEDLENSLKDIESGQRFLQTENSHNDFLKKQ